MVRSGLLSLGHGHPHINIATAAPGADQPLAPVENRSLIAVSPGHLRWIGSRALQHSPRAGLVVLKQTT